MATDTSKITGAADDLSDKLTKGGSAAKTLGAEIANAIKSLDDRVSAIEAGGGTQPPIEPPSESTGGLIADFTGLNERQWKLDGVPVSNQNANTSGNKSWCLQQKDDYTLRFENRQGDDWDSPYAGTGCNRNEVGVGDGEVYCFADGVEGNGSFTLTVEPGPANKASWCTIVQVHAISDTPPCPFAMGLQQNTDKLSVVLQDPVGGNNYIYDTPQGLVRGQAYKIRFQFKMGPSGGGYARVWIDDAQVVNFSGKIGASGNTKYWYKFGIYRGATSETLSMVFKNVYLRPSYKDGAWVNT
jgi:hypothetical protein